MTNDPAVSAITPELDLEATRARIRDLAREGADHVASWIESYGHFEGPDPECVACDDLFGTAAMLRDLVQEIERLRAALLSSDRAVKESE